MNEAVPASYYSEDIDQEAGNYVYDKTGNLTHDPANVINDISSQHSLPT